MKNIQNILVIPDSFKGGMSSQRICDLCERAVHAEWPHAEVVKLPVADGGEGSVDALLAAAGGEKIFCAAANPFNEETQSFYGLLPDGTAIVEMAAAAGLPQAGARKNPMITTTFGVGQLMAHAIKNGCKQLILAMGGSATNDAGCGAAAALGVRFYNAEGESFVPVGGTLSQIARIDTTGCQLHVPIIAMCDIDNPLYGAAGAAFVYAPQKGADAAMVQCLDEGLRHFAQVAKRDCGVDVSLLPGAGAAGGLGAGAVAFWGARLQMGIETVLDAVHFDAQLAKADLVITGEGRIDTQSLRGKVVLGVAKRAKAQNVPVIALVGDVGDGIDSAYEQGVSAVFSINRVALPFDQAVLRSEADLYATVRDIMRFAKIS